MARVKGWREKDGWWTPEEHSLVVQLGSHVGLDESRTNTVASDTAAGKLLGVRHGHTDDTALSSETHR